jgi:hypothetical protein
VSGGVWLASYVVLWGAVAVLLVVVLALVRQIGVLHGRLDDAVSGAGGAGIGAGVGSASGSSGGPGVQPRATKPAVREGPPVGVLAPMPGRLGYARSPLTLVAFTSAGCELSRMLAPSLRVLDQQYDDVRVVELPLGSRTITAFEAFKVEATPFVVAVDREGVVRGRGRARTLAQLEDLVAVASRPRARSSAPGPADAPARPKGEPSAPATGAAPAPAPEVETAADGAAPPDATKAAPEATVPAAPAPAPESEPAPDAEAAPPVDPARVNA